MGISFSLKQQAWIQVQPTLDDKAFAQPSRRGLFPSGSTGMLLRVLLTVVFALIAQSALEPPNRSALTGLVFYILAFSWLLWSYFRGEWGLGEAPTGGGPTGGGCSR